MVFGHDAIDRRVAGLPWHDQARTGGPVTHRATRGGADRRSARGGLYRHSLTAINPGYPRTRGVAGSRRVAGRPRTRETTKAGNREGICPLAASVAASPMG